MFRTPRETHEPEFTRRFQLRAVIIATIACLLAPNSATAQANQWYFQSNRIDIGGNIGLVAGHVTVDSNHPMYGNDNACSSVIGAGETTPCITDFRFVDHYNDPNRALAGIGEWDTSDTVTVFELTFSGDPATANVSFNNSLVSIMDSQPPGMSLGPFNPPTPRPLFISGEANGTLNTNNFLHTSPTGTFTLAAPNEPSPIVGDSQNEPLVGFSPTPGIVQYDSFASDCINPNGNRGCWVEADLPAGATGVNVTASNGTILEVGMPASGTFSVTGDTYSVVGIVPPLAPTAVSAAEFDISIAGSNEIAINFANPSRSLLPFFLATSGTDVTITSMTVSAPLLGDYNLDDEVNTPDYNVWRDSFGDIVPNGTGADGNNDGKINAADYNVWRDNFGNTADSLASLPESSSVSLLLISVLVGACSRCRRGATMMRIAF